MRCKVSDFFALSEVPPSFSLRLTLFSPYFYTLFTLKRATCEVSFANKGGAIGRGIQLTMFRQLNAFLCTKVLLLVIRIVTPKDAKPSEELSR